MAGFTTHLAEIVNRDAGYIGTAPDGDFTVAMLADDKCVNASAVHVEMFTKLIFKSGSVKDCTRAEDTDLRKPGKLPRHMSEDINRI